MSEQPKGRGRARGRARGTEPAPQGQRPGSGAPPSRGGQQRGGPSGPPSQPRGPAVGGPPQPQPSAWGPRGDARQAPSQSAPVSGGRAFYRGGISADAPGAEAHHSTQLTSEGDNGNGNGNNGGPGALRRGTVRGRRQLHEAIIRTRPDSLATKLGTYGTTIRLHANYFKFLKKADWCLFQYRVDFAPELDNTRVKRALFRRATREILAGSIFDGTVLFTSARINPEPMELFVQDEKTQENYRISMRLVGDVSKADYQYLQVFNIILRKCLGHLNLQMVGRDFFDAVAKIDVPDHRMELWPGYLTSIRQHETQVLLNAEMTFKVMRHDTVYSLLTECIQNDRSDYKRLFNQKIIGSVVLTQYNNRTYHIDDVDYSTNPNSTFEKRDRTVISYKDYFQQKYNLRIREPGQPMLVSRAKAREIRAGMAEKVYLVPELCLMTGLTDEQKSNFNLMRAVANHTRMSPGDRIQKLLRFNERLRKTPEILQELQTWDLDLAHDLTEFSGRVLPPEAILGGGGEKYSAGKDVDWTKELRSRPMLYTAPINCWVVVCPNRFTNSARAFMQLLNKAAHGMSWNLPSPKLQEIRDDRPPSYLEGIEAALNTHKPQLIMCIASNNKADRYAAIKKKCCVDRACPTQVMLAKNLESKGAMSIATKVAIQMNCKLGGAPWCIPLPYKSMMVVGYDACHDTSHREKSFGAVVATLNPECSRYFSTVSAHTSGEELSNDFSLSIIKAARKFQGVNGMLPERILIYRDGVGEGQLDYVVEHEVNRIKADLAKLYGSADKVKMAFIVVSKRIKTRIFSGKDNPPPGTVVDDVITLPERYDFFIVSQCVRQGTVSPTSYNVIFDSMGQEADKIQRITYKLTHMYFNWSGTVRVPAPCQYAHKLAFLAAQALHRNPHPDLENVLYFL